MSNLLCSVLVAFAAQQDPDAALDAFQKSWREGDDDGRIAAIEALAETKHAKVLARLAPLVASGPSRIRGAAAKALGEFSEHRRPASTALLNALPANAKDTPVLDAIFQSIVRLQEPGASPALARFFDDKDIQTARGAIAASGKLGHPGVVDPLIAVVARCEKLIKANSGDAVEYVDPNTGTAVVARPDTDRHARAKALHDAATQSLRSLTGASHASAEAWAAWWARNRANFPAPK
jgi:hypothetical protein